MKKIKRLIVCSLVLGLSLFIGKEEVSAQQGLGNLQPWMVGQFNDEPTFGQNITYKDINSPKICCFKLEYPKGSLKILDSHREGDFVPIKVFSTDFDSHINYEGEDDSKLANKFKEFTLESIRDIDLSKSETEDFIRIKDVNVKQFVESYRREDMFIYTKEYANQLAPIENFTEKNIRFELNGRRFYSDNNRNGFHDIYLKPLNNVDKSYAVRTEDKDLVYIDFIKVSNLKYLRLKDLPRMHYFKENLLMGNDFIFSYNKILEGGLPLPKSLLSEIESRGFSVDDFYKIKDGKIYGIMNLFVAEEDFNIPFLVDYSKYPNGIVNKDEIFNNTTQISVALSKNYEIFTADESEMSFEENYWKEIVWKDIDVAKDEVLIREDLLKAMSYNFKDFYTINTDAIQFYTKVKVKEESGSGMTWSPAVYEEASIEDILPINFSELNEEDLEKFKEMTITARLSQEDVNGIGGEYTFKNFNEFKVKVVDAGLGKVYKGYNAHDFGAYKKIYRTFEEATNKECICEREMVTPPPPAPEEPEDPIEPEPTPPEEPRSEIPPTYPTYELPEINFNIPPNPPVTEEKPRIDIVVPPNPPIVEDKPEAKISIPPNPPTVNEKPKGEVPPEPPKPNTPPPVTPPKEDKPKAPPKKTNEMPKTNLDSNLNLLIFSEVVFLVFFVGSILKQKRED